MQDKKNAQKLSKSEEYIKVSTNKGLETLFIGECLDSKGDKMVRIKQKIYDEIMALREQDHTKINNTINCILASHIFNSKNGN